MSAESLWQISGAQIRRGRHAWPATPLELSIAPGHTAVLGLSGSGKTSLLNLLSGFIEPAAGKVHRPSRMAWVPQDHGLWPAHSVAEHLSLAGASPAEVSSLLEIFDLSALAGQRAEKLSHGEGARLSVARALAQDAPVLVMDEPLAHVDTARSGQYWRALRARIANGSSVIATHQPEVALGMASRAICLRAGAVVFHGPIAELYESPASEELASFLGPANWLTSDESALWLDTAGSPARCFRPERLQLMPAAGGNAVTASRFLGSHAETDLRHPSGATKTFLHRPASALPIGARVAVKEIPRG